MIRDAPYPVFLHSTFDKIGTVTSCKFVEMSPCSEIGNKTMKDIENKH